MDAESERRTRRTRIDPKLVSAGWRVAPFDVASGLGHYHQCAIEEFETDNGPADYALCVDRVLLGIVEAIEALFKFAEQIEARYKKARAQVNKLTQSILAKAFRGELVPTEAELARGEDSPSRLSFR